MGRLRGFISWWSLAFFSSGILSTALALVLENPWIMAELPETSQDNDQEQSWTEPRVPQRRRKGSRPQNRDCWKEPLIQVEYITPDSTNTLFQPFMLLLAGLPGSGKSTLARSLVDAMPYKFARVNQDEMKSRNNCVTEAKKAMANGLSVIVDRCNFDTSQRQVWYDLAAQYHYPVDCVVFQVSIPICIQRCQQRTNHETVAPNEAARIVNLVHRQWKSPTRQEKLQSLRSCRQISNSTEFNKALLGYLQQK